MLSGIADYLDIRTGIENEADGINSAHPAAYRLDQNFPNPFNPETKIRYSLAGAGKVSLILYDILGRKVAVLVNSYKSAGTYEVLFNASRLNSGAYVYVLSAGKYRIMKKMLLLK